MDDPEVLPYNMEAVESGYAGTRKGDMRGVTKQEDSPVQATNGYSATVGQEDFDEVLDEATEENPQEEE